MVNIAKKLFTVSIAFLLAGAFCFADEVLSESASSSNSSSSSTSSDFSKNIKSLEGHRFIEVRGAFPVFPALTSHGAVQSFAVGFADLFGAAFTPHDKFEATTPKFATDLNITFYPPIANYHFGFMAGTALDYWESSRSAGKTEEFSMNFYYIGFHADYGHWVFTSGGMRLSIYGEISLGWLNYKDSSDSSMRGCFDFCPFGIQFCPEKHVGIYLEIPHIGGRPFFQTGLSLGL